MEMSVLSEKKVIAIKKDGSDIVLINTAYEEGDITEEERAYCIVQAKSRINEEGDPCLDCDHTAGQCADCESYSKFVDIRKQ